MIRNDRAVSPSRGGFTLIELLTVIAIMGVLLGLAVGAYFRVRVSQEEKHTEVILNKLQSAFDAQRTAVQDNASDDLKKSRVPSGVVTMAGGDNRRAKVIWQKILYKMEFPQNFWEAIVWQNSMSLTYGLTPRPSFQRSLVMPPLNIPIVPLDPATLTVDQVMQESAVLLYITLGQGRRGVNTFNPNEHLGPHALGKITLAHYPGSPEFPIFVDTWGQPIGFIRSPFGGGLPLVGGGALQDLNVPPYQARNNQGQPIDPQDPEMTLLESQWYNSANRPAFELTVNGGAPITNPPMNLTPVICSSGRDKQWGFSASPLTALQRFSGDEDDNIYAFRMKGVGRSN